MRHFSARVLVPAVLLSAAASAQGATQLFATLTNGAETSLVVPTLVNLQPRPISFGTATFTLNDQQTAMSMNVEVFNIDFTGNQTTDPNDNLTNAHIHAGPLVTPTTNGGVVWGFIGSPFNDNNPANVLVTPFATGVGGTVVGTWDMAEGNNTTLTAQIDNILAGRSYINFHTNQFTGGEVRGNIFIPEPASLGMLGVGALALLTRRRKAK